MPDRDIYHVIFTISNLRQDPTSELQKVRVCGTYSSIKAAQAAAHQALFDAGYEQEWFKVFDSKTHGTTNWTHGPGVLVYAVAPEGEIFTVSVYTTTDTLGFDVNADGKVDVDLYHVLQTTIFYDKDASGANRETNIEGTYKSYTEALSAARTVLLNKEDGLTKESWAEYDEIPVGEKDWEYGENAVVHAVGANGENVIVSVVKEDEMESVRIVEAARRLDE